MNTNCNDVKSLLIDYLDGQLAPAIRDKVEEHLKGCMDCREEIVQFKKMFGEMASTKLEQPSPALKENFNLMLQSELNISATMEMLKSKEEPKIVKMRTGSRWLQIAASVLLVAGGMFAGMQLKNTPVPIAYNGTEITDLKEEVKEMKEAMLLNLLNEESASDRIRAVGYADEINNPDPKIIHALINTLNEDKNLNVRLAAINSLAKFSGNPIVVDSLIASLSKQKEPLLQIVLIKILTDQKQTKAIEPIKAILSNKQTLQPVKEMAEQGLKKVM
jgi:hypothetical protein